MKVVLLSTRRLRAHMVETARAELGLEASEAPHLTVVSWNPPIGRLRVGQHLVVGPVLSPTGRARYARVDPSIADDLVPDDDPTPETELVDAVDDVAPEPTTERSGAASGSGLSRSSASGWDCEP